jgi:DNA polymerase I - 3''-5'' exonuclease and polymerase domains
LPPKKWRDDFDYQPVEELFRLWEFRGLIARLKSTLEFRASTQNLTLKDSDTIQTELLNTAVYDTTSHDFHECAIALWLLNSNITSPQTADIFAHTQTTDLVTAREKLEAELLNKNLDFVYSQIELPIIDMVAEMSKNGVKIDKTYLKYLSQEYHQELAKLEQEIWQMAGDKFNISSPKQLGEILFIKMGLASKRQKKTSTGNFSTQESELLKIRDVHPIIEKLLQYRELEKLLSTYIDKLPDLLGEDGKIHAIFDQTGTSTGRFSSMKPNLQNIPMRTELGRKIRGAFLANDGYRLVSFDYSQIELRIAAFLSGDQKLIEIFQTGQDVHRAVAAQVFKIPENEVSTTQRNQAKTINFGIIYGMGINALRFELKTTREEAQQFYNEYFASFPQLAAYLERVKNEAGQQGYTETYFGRRRYFDGLKSKIPYVRAMAERMAINAPIQGTEADIIKLAMKEIWLWIQRAGLSSEVRILLQVHDELVFEIKEDKIIEATKIITAKAEQVMSLYPKFIAPSSEIVCSVNSKSGKNWLEMK